MPGASWTISRRWPATAPLARTRRWWRGWRVSAAGPSPSSARKRATTPKAASSTISARPCPKAIARRCASSNWPDRFGLPVLTLLRHRRRLSGRHRPKSAARPKPSPVRSRRACRVKAPFIATIIGEGMSGGAIAIAAANRVYMLEHSIYSVISPEGCASILWRSADKAQEAATALKITAQDLLAAEGDRRHRARAGRRRPSRAAGSHRRGRRPDRARA